MYAALIELDICAADVQNAYVQTPTSEKHYVICGPEFREHIGKKALIKRALYGGKCAGQDHWLYLRSCMDFLGFKPYKADPDVWMRASKRTVNTDYWKYVLLYVDDCRCISTNPGKIIRDEIWKYFLMKEASIGEPDIYLDGKVRKVELDIGIMR